VIGIDTDALFSKIEEGRTKAEKVRNLFQALSFYTGARFTAIDEEEEGYKRAQSIYYSAIDEKTKASKQKPGYERRSANHRRDMDKVYRRLGLL
jgi:hypothetical protein